MSCCFIIMSTATSTVPTLPTWAIVSIFAALYLLAVVAFWSWAIATAEEVPEELAYLF